MTPGVIADAGTSRGIRSRVLVDLAHASDGYVGIAQDTRVNFDMLAGLRNVTATGMLMPAGRHDLPRISPKQADDLAVQAGVLHWMARNWDSERLRKRSGRFGEVIRSLRNEYDLLAFEGNRNIIWRTLFEKTLPSERRELILAQDFRVTDLSVMRIVDRATRLRALASHRLNTIGFDHVLFSMPRPVRLSPGTRQLVRFHDAVPLTDIDTQDNWLNAFAHQQLTRLCSRDAVFVCNSPQSREDLERLDPGRAEFAEMVPCALAPAASRLASGIPFETIATARRTFRTLERPPAQKPRITPGRRYVLTIGTLEPRKNQISLIRAWERVISRSDPKLQLVIVGNQGWREDAIVSAMRPHVLSGRIIHLEKLPTDELAAVARGAECFVFPSFNEGFGYPPLEALLAGTSCAISDIPVFRWTFGKGALYFDPYNVESIASAIERLCVHEDRASLKAELNAQRALILDRFSMQTVSREWERLFDKLQGRREPGPARSGVAPAMRAMSEVSAA